MSDETLGLPADYVDDGTLAPVDPVYPFDPSGPNPDYTVGFSQGYAAGYTDATEKADGDDDPVDEMALTFSHADLILLGVGFLALAIPVGILLSRTERPNWKLPWN